MNKITTVYQKNTKQDGNTLNANEWNSISEAVNVALTKINEIIDNTEENPSNNNNSLISINNKGNVTIGSNDVKNVNIEPGYPYSLDTTKYGDIALKPGDDIQFASHHREPKKRDKIVIKNIDGSDNPVKLQTVAAEIELAVGTKKNPKTATKKKDKTTGNDTSEAMFKTDDAKTLDIAILTGNILDEGGNDERDERGYLKVRALAIDLRCEKHGGIALQPKGYDSSGNMNKIKFEHGGGDGLEFGTFNTEKSSLYTDEYRFKKTGVVKLATRTTETSGKTIRDEGDIPLGKNATATYKYVKLPDDFYDIINTNDKTATWELIIEAANMFGIEFKYVSSSDTSELVIGQPPIPLEELELDVYMGTTSESDPMPPVGFLGTIYTTDSLENYLNIPTGELKALVDELPYPSHITLTVHYTWTHSSENTEVQDTVSDTKTATYYFIKELSNIVVHSNNGDISIDDIYTVINYFKTNNSTGPFANS